MDGGRWLAPKDTAARTAMEAALWHRAGGARRTQRRGCTGEWRSDAAGAQRPERRQPWQRKDEGALMGDQQRHMLDERWRCPGQRWTMTQAVARLNRGTLGRRRRRGNGVVAWSSGTRLRLLQWWRKEEGPGRCGATWQ
jgi:hypothetical protein